MAKDLKPVAEGELVAPLDDQIVESMHQSHPIYGAFGQVFKDIGGIQALAEWAKDEPGKFYRLFANMVPRDPSANQINIQINAKLAPSPLDE
jgi:hypothetical protein